MGWSIFCSLSTITGGQGTAWVTGTSLSGGPYGKTGNIYPGTAWPGSTALGFYGNGSGGPITVGNWQAKTAMVYSTATPTISKYICNIKPITTTGFAVSTKNPSGGDYYYYRAYATQFATPRPTYGTRFRFDTAGSVSVTAASAYWGKVINAGGTINHGSALCGFELGFKLLNSSRAWTWDATSGAKMAINTNANGRDASNYSSKTSFSWHLGMAVRPKSAGAKTGGVALEITYS